MAPMLWVWTLTEVLKQGCNLQQPKGRQVIGLFLLIFESSPVWLYVKYIGFYFYFPFVFILLSYFLSSNFNFYPCLQVQTVKQGYLLKRSSSSRGDWKRRFFVLDNQGNLYYYRVKGVKPMVVIFVFICFDLSSNLLMFTSKSVPRALSHIIILACLNKIVACLVDSVQDTIGLRL